MVPGSSTYTHIHDHAHMHLTTECKTDRLLEGSELLLPAAAGECTTVSVC
jgi:hypothetical protein